MKKVLSVLLAVAMLLTLFAAVPMSANATDSPTESTDIEGTETPQDIAVTKISLNKSSASFLKGKTLTLKATITPSNATDKTIIWSSSNKKVATVDNKGKVTAKSAGITIITAKTSNGKKVTCKITITSPPTSVKLNKSKLTLGLKETCQLTGTISPSTPTNKTLTWTSSNKKIATVSKGKITAIALGKAVITVKTVNGKKSTCSVTVCKAPSKITLSAAKKALTEGNSFSLKYTLPKNTYSNKITFTSSNKSVATVSSAGVIKALKKGTVKITAKTYNGKKAVCTVTVKAKPLTKEEKAIKNFNSLKTYIKNHYDGINSNGFKYIRLRKTDIYGAVYEYDIIDAASLNKIRFSSKLTYNYNETTYIDFDADFNSSFWISPRIVRTSYMSLQRLDTRIDARGYIDNSSLRYTTTGSTYPTQSEINLADSEVSLSFIGWDNLLFKRTGMEMKDIGFFAFIS